MGKNKRKKKKGRKLFACMIVILGFLAIAALAVLLFYVQKIEIAGNEYTSAQEIASSIEEDPCSANSLYLLCKYAFFDYDAPGSIESMRVRLKNPWTVKVEVKEKAIAGCVADAAEYVYFDREGTIVLKDKTFINGTLRVEGIPLGNTKLYGRLLEEDEELLQLLLDTTGEMEKNGLAPDKIAYEDGGMTLYFGGIRVLMGNQVTAEKAAQISPILDEISEHSGVLHLEHYEGEGSTITFDSEDFSIENEDDEQKMDENL